MQMKTYRVGGCVRDRIMGRVSNDIDYVVEVESFDAMREGIIAMGGKIFVENPEFLTIRARIDGETYDYVMARQDGEYRDGRRPETVTPGTIFDDLARRDFTMNAIAENADGTLIDPYNGIEDITRRIIRCVGNPDRRFQEDGLRIIRAIRFAATFGFFIEAETQAAMERNAEMINSVSVERIREEMEKAFRVDTIATIKMIESFGLTKIIFSRGLRASATMKN